MARKEKIRILYLQTFPLYGSGSGTYARNLAIAVRKLGAKTAIVCPDNRPLNGVKLFTFEMPLHVAFTGHPEWPDCKLYTQINNIELLKLYESFLDAAVNAVEEFKPHIIHVHHAFPFSWAARFVKSTYSIPYLITIHGSELPTAQKDKRYIALTTDTLRKSRRIVPNSFWTKEWLRDIFGDSYRKQIRVIPGGVDVDKFKKVDTADIDKNIN